MLETYPSDGLFVFINSDPPTPLSSSMKRTNRNSRNNEGDQETVKDMCKSLSAADWTERLQGINQLQEMAETNKELVASNIVKVCFDLLFLRF